MQKRTDPDATALEPHVFDQTNGVVDLGADEPKPAATTEGTDADRRRAVGGIAMLSVKRP